DGRSQESFEGHCSRDVRRTPDRARVHERYESDCGVSLGAVDEGDALLGTERDGPGANLTEQCCGVRLTFPFDQRSLADEREAQMRERREVSTRADAALLRDRGIHIRIQHA